MQDQNKGYHIDNDEEVQNSINIKILDSILDDDDETFLEIVSQICNDEMNFNQQFKLTSYTMPKILSFQPTYSSLCAFFGSEKCMNSLISLFPDGIRSKFFNKKDNQGRQPIHFACMSGNLSILRLFYQEEFDFNESDNSGKKPSHYAAMCSNCDAIKYLWTKGIDVLKQSDRKGLTPFHIACKYGNIEIIKFLCETVAKKGDLKFETINKNYYYHNRISTPLHLACESGCADVVKYILNNKEMKKNQMKAVDFLSRRPIDCAIEKKNLECIKLLAQASKANVVGYNRKHIPLIEASLNGSKDIVLFLLRQKNIQIDAVDADKYNALSAAIKNKHLDVVKILIENGIGDKLDKHLINEAFLDAFRCEEIFEYLDEKLDIPYKQMEYSFMNRAISLENKYLVDFLLNKNCTFNDINSYGKFIYKWTPFMSFLKEKGFDFSHCTDLKRIPLIVKSIRHGNLEAIKDLINKGIELDADIISDYDCILDACTKGKIELFNFLISYKPEIRNLESCILTLIDRYDQFKKHKKPNKKLINDCIEMVEILIKQYDFNVDNNRTICKSIQILSIEFLELFEKYSANFDAVNYNYSRMVSKEFIPIFHFLEDKGCTFRNFNSHYSCQYNYNSKNYKKVIYFKSPIFYNIMESTSSNYDVNTLLFLMKYATNNELIYSNSYNGNIVDVLISFNCFDPLLEVYKKLNRILYPLKSSNNLKELIDDSGNKELIDIFENFEEEELNEKETSYYKFGSN